MLSNAYLLLCFLGSLFIAETKQKTFTISGRAQGTTYQIQYVSEEPIVGESSIDSIMDAIDRSMSLYQPHSLICSFNRSFQKSAEVDGHMVNVLRESFRIHKKSNGLFDITVKPLMDLWGFGTESVNHLPEREAIDSIRALVGMDKIWLEGMILYKSNPKISIDLNGIAQGYTVDVLADFLESRGIENYLVELGGEIRVKGTKIGGNSYEISIERPFEEQSSNLLLQISNAAVTTSGNYRNFFQHQGKTIHHHIDPKTGYPIQNNVLSATVIASTAMEADGYDNVFMALSPIEGITLANTLPNIEVYLIYDDDGILKEAFSNGFHQYVKK